METKKDLIGNELIQEIIAVKVDALWRMLALKKDSRLPRVDEEGATGSLDNKGAIFVPGPFIYEDSDRKAIWYDSVPNLKAKKFRELIRDSLRYDNATLLFNDGIAPAVNLDNGFFAEMAGRIIAIKEAAVKRKMIQNPSPPAPITSHDLTRSYCPTYVPAPYGSRTKLSSCIAVCLIEPAMYFVQCRNAFGLRGDENADFWDKIRAAKKPIVDGDGKTLAGPHVVVCHATRYKKEILPGIVRILGFGRFGEFAVFTLEEASAALTAEIEGGQTPLGPGDYFAEYDGSRIVGVLRIFPHTTPGKRLQRTTTTLVSPSRDVTFDLKEITQRAKERYRVK
jgi:hypothetical protein